MDTCTAKAFVNVPFQIYSSVYSRSCIQFKNSSLYFEVLCTIFHWFPNLLCASLTNFFEYVHHFLSAWQMEFDPWQ